MAAYNDFYPDVAEEKLGDVQSVCQCTDWSKTTSTEPDFCPDHNVEQCQQSNANRYQSTRKIPRKVYI